MKPKHSKPMKRQSMQQWLAAKDQQRVRAAKRAMAEAIEANVPGGMQFMRDLAMLCPGSMPVQVVVDGVVVADLVELVK